MCVCVCVCVVKDLPKGLFSWRAQQRHVMMHLDSQGRRETVLEITVGAPGERPLRVTPVRDLAACWGRARSNSYAVRHSGSHRNEDVLLSVPVATTVTRGLLASRLHSCDCFWVCVLLVKGGGGGGTALRLCRFVSPSCDGGCF